MGTNSFIGQMQTDGAIRGIYCHWDGFVECTGYMLVRHYENRDKVAELLNLGELSFLGSAPNDGTCAYARNGGENLKPATLFHDLDDVLRIKRDYFYVQMHNGWIYSRGEDWKPVPQPPPPIVESLYVQTKYI